MRGLAPPRHARKQRSDPDDSQLVKRLRQGDSSAWRELYERYADQVYAYVSATLRDRERARDVTHDVFVKVLDRIDRYEGSGPFRAWLFRVARNCAFDELRVIKPEPVDPELLHRLDRPAELDHISDRELYDAIERLPDDYVQVIVSRFLLGFNCREIAALIGRTPNAVRKLQVRALAQLRSELLPVPAPCRVALAAVA